MRSIGGRAPLHQIFHRQCCDAEQEEFDEEPGAADVSYDDEKGEVKNLAPCTGK